MIVSTSSYTVQLTEDIDQLARNTLHSDLNRLADDILSVDVCVNDINGHQHGASKQAIIRAHLRNRHEITIETVEESVAVAIQRGSEQVRRAVGSCVTN